MKRIAIVSLSVLFLLLIGLLIVPSFFDLNKHKATIVTQVEKATGFEVQIAGNINAALLPAPQAKIAHLTVKAPKGSAKNLLTLEQLNVSVKLGPLLSKKIVVDSVKLVKPTIQVEKLADGSFSYMTDKLFGAKEVQSDAPKKAPDVAFDRIEIEKGTIIYSDAGTGQNQTISNLDMALRADTLKGPFKAAGYMTYNQQEVEFDVASGVLQGASDPLKLQAQIKLPGSSSAIIFDGTVVQDTQEIAGKAQIKTDSIAKMAAISGAALPDSLDKAFSFDGALKGNANAFAVQDASLSLAGTPIAGSMAVAGLKDKNPVQVKGAFQSSDLLDIDQFIPRSAAPAEKGAGIPKTVQMPFSLTADITAKLAAVRMGGQAYRDVNLALKKEGKQIAITKTVGSAPGETSITAKADIGFASSSQSAKTGAVTYSDPSLSFDAKGTIGSVAKLANAYNIQLSPEARTINSASFDVNGSLLGEKIVLRDSAIKLDDMTLALAGSYQPASPYPKVSMDVSADTVNLDKFIGSKGEQPAAPAGNPMDALKSFTVPYDAAFDVSAQKLIFQGKTIEGLRVVGTAKDKALSLSKAGVNSYLDSAFSAKGSIGDVSTLSGLDMNVAVETSDAKKLLQNLNMKVEGLLAQIDGAAVNAHLTGSAANMGLKANVKALSGQVDVEGKVADALTKPQISDLALGVSHPNFVKAMQIVNPAFKAGAGLQQKVDFYAKVNQSGKTYDLTGIKGSFGPMPISGSMNVDLGSSIPGVNGSIALGDVPLDSFLGDEQAASARKSGGAASGGERYSDRPIDVSWINKANVNMGITANSLQYGGWNFVKPQTTVTMGSGSLKLTDLKAGMAGGSAVVNATLSPRSEGGMSAALASSLSDVSLEQLAYALSNSNKLKAQGDVSFTMDVKTAGLSNAALVNALNGVANLDGRSITFEGFNLAKLAAALRADIKPGDTVQGLLGGVRGGTTRFDTIKGDYAITNGVVNISSMVMDGPEAAISSKGSASLPKWTIDTVHTISLKNTGEEEVPSFDVAIKGPLDNPANTFGQGILNDFLKRKIERKLNSLVQDQLQGTKFGDTLQKLGIGGTPAQQAPANNNAPEQQAPAAGEEAQPQTQPASPLDGILNENDPTEKAIKGVLDGLLR